jgi:hypothetical protein
LFVESPPTPDLVIAEVQERVSSGQQSAKTLLPLPKRQRANGFAIEVEQIEQEEHQSTATGVRCVLDQAERRGAIRQDAAQFAVEIGLPRRERRDRRGDRRVFMGPVEAGAGQQPDRAAVEPSMHPVAVEFEFLQPLRTIWWLIDQFGELRFDPARQRRRFEAPASGERSRHVFRHDTPAAAIDLSFRSSR